MIEEELPETLLIVEFGTNRIDADTLLKMISEYTEHKYFWIHDYQIIKTLPIPSCSESTTSQFGEGNRKTPNRNVSLEEGSKPGVSSSPCKEVSGQESSRSTTK